MRPHLAHFLKNNDPPSEAILAEVDDLTAGPKTEIEAKFAEIQRLRKKLEELQKERQAIKQSMETYSIILSPIRRVPSDVLKRIFDLCLPMNHNAVMSVIEAPLVLIRVCRLWRSTALSCPGLWAKLHLAIPPYPFPNDDQYFPYQGAGMKSDAEREVEKQRYARVIEARGNLTGEWLSRSGTHPLSISVAYMGSIDQTVLEELKNQGHVPKLFDTLVSFSRQFENLELDLPYDLCHLLLSRISLPNVSALRQLRISLCDRIPFTAYSPAPTPRVDNSKRTITLFQASGLTRLSVRGDTIAQSAFDSSKLPDTWANFTHLSLDFGITSADVLHIFRLCQKLEDCNLVINDCQDVYIDPEEVLLLPHLKFLRMKANGHDLMSLLYKRIRAPALNWFEYQAGGSTYPSRAYNYAYYSPGAYPNSHNLTPTTPVLSLFESSRRIKTLSFDPRSFSPRDTLFSLRFMKQLTHLVIGQRSVRSGSWIPSSPPAYFNLDLLVIAEESDEEQPEKEVLLPNLEVFEAYNLESRANTMEHNPPSPLPIITDELVKRFITGRLGNASRGVRSLKSVRINFSRKKEEDIQEEIHRRAEDLGLAIELDLTYVTPPEYSKYRDTFSPWYGLSEDDRSWRYVDADAEDDD